MTDQRLHLQEIARRAMREKGLEPDFPARALEELRVLPPAPGGNGIRDLRDRLWCSIDNDDSRDLDQLTVAETEPDGTIRLLVAVADVDALVHKRMALDDHARQNTTSVYTAAQIFPMLPERLSTDLTSLGFQADRAAMVVELSFSPDGTIRSETIYRALVRNRAKLAYNSTGAWLEGRGGMPRPIGAVPGMEEALRLQDRLAGTLRGRRFQQGTLIFETIESHPVFEGPTLTGWRVEKRNRAKDLIEDFMIAANGAAVRYLAGKGWPSLRRIVRTPRRWERIVAIAKERGTDLPAGPDSKSLQRFLQSAKAADPEGFPDLSLAVIKLLGSGEYVVELPNRPAPGHFGLALKDYTHSTAPNRRFPDLITQRLLKAAGAGQHPPYSGEELATLARHCTEREDSVKKIERKVAKAAAAILLAPRVGEIFEAIITAVANNGTWLRILNPPTEGKLVAGRGSRDTGDRLRVRLVETDPDRGYIDFEAAP